MPFYRNRQLNFKMYSKYTGPRIAKQVCKRRVRGLKGPDFKTYCKAAVITTMRYTKIVYVRACNWAKTGNN